MLGALHHARVRAIARNDFNQQETLREAGRAGEKSLDARQGDRGVVYRDSRTRYPGPTEAITTNRIRHGRLTTRNSVGRRLWVVD